MRFPTHFYDVYVENANNCKCERYDVYTTYKEALKEAKQAKCTNNKVFVIIRRGSMRYADFHAFANRWYETHKYMLESHNLYFAKVCNIINK